MKLTAVLILSVIILGLTSCTQYAYFQSPLHTNTNPYRTLPLKSDSSKSGWYASGTFTTGGANNNQKDGTNGFIASVYRAHQFGHFNAYYGLTGMLGNYHINKYDTTTYYYHPNQNLSPQVLNTLGAGTTKFFGGAGLIGGMNFVLPFANGGEWRIIGAEFNWQHEYGNYLTFRQSLPDTAANLIARSPDFVTIALGTDFVFHTRRGSIGWKYATVYSTETIKKFDENRNPQTRSSRYESFTFHLSINHFTGFSQFNFGSYAVGMQLGVNYRIGR